MKKERGFPRRKNPPRKCKRRFEGPGGAELKRRRVARAAKEKGLYFDTLPLESVENILRFTSEKPRHTDWTSFVEPQVALTLLKSGGNLSTCARQTFHALEANEMLPSERNGILVLGVGHESRQKFPSMVSALSGSLVELRVKRPTFPKTWNRSLVKHCQSLKHLSLITHYPSRNFSLAEILAARSGKLKGFELRVPALNAIEVNAIATHCRALQRLALRFESLSDSLTPVWQAVGTQLAELHLQCGNKEVFDSGLLALHAVGEHCSNMQRMQLTALRTAALHTEIEYVCRRLGVRLQSLVLAYTKICPAILGRITAHCPNVEIDLRDCQGCDVSSMLAMGSRASSMAIGCFTTDRDGTVANLTRVSEACPNLRTVKLEHATISENALSALFAYPKPRLVHFSAEYISEKTITVVLDVLAEKIDTLETFEYCGQNLPIFPMRKFAATNKTLRRVQLRTWRPCMCHFSEAQLMTHSRPTLGMNWPSFVDAFLLCPNLRELDFSCTGKNLRRFNELVNVCHPARSRNISVSVCGYQYL